jgi:hypothetical protein
MRHMLIEVLQRGLVQEAPESGLEYRKIKRPLFINKKSTAGRVSCQACESSIKAVSKTRVFGATCAARN